MHELSIVMSIVDIATEEAYKAGVSKFDSIELDIGTLSGIVFDALDFAWQATVTNTVLDGAKCNINKIQAVSQCRDCGHKFETKTLYEACPKCGSYFTLLIKGNELKIKSLIIDC